MNRRMDICSLCTDFPCILLDIVPFGAAAQTNIVFSLALFPSAFDEKRFDLFIRLVPNVIDYLEKRTNKNKLQQSLLQIGFVGDVQVETLHYGLKGHKI